MAEVVLSTAGMALDAEQVVQLTVSNPSPGGGRVSTAFGVNPERGVQCPVEGACVATMRHTRRPLADGWGRAVDLIPGQVFVPEMAVHGATGVTVVDPLGRTLARVVVPPEGGRVPLPIGDIAALRFEDERGSNRALQLTSAPSVPTGDFEPAVRVYDGVAILQVVVAELDGMPGLDLAIASGDRLEVLSGRGDGRFDDPVTVPMGFAPSAPVVADLDGDGMPDLIGATREQLAWRLGRGGLDFAEVQRGARESGRALTSLDWNRDGVTDVVAFSSGARPIMHLGDGRGGLHALPSCPDDETAPGCIRLARAGQHDVFADIDGDGRVDQLNGAKLQLAVPGVGVLLAAGRLDADDHVHSRHVADFDLDGTGDLAVGYLDRDVAHVWGSRGDGTVTPRRAVRLPIVQLGTGMHVADVNGDRMPDLLAPAREGGALFYLAGDGDGGFGPGRRVADGERDVRRVQVADLNIDGVPDLVIHRTAIGAGHVEVALGRAQPAEGTWHRVPAPMLGELEVVDFDRDGLLDVIAVSDRVVDGRESTFVHVFPGQPDGTLGPRVEFASGQNGNPRLAVGDVTGDGAPDLVISSPFDTRVAYVARLDGAADGELNSVSRFIDRVRLDDPSTIRLADLDGDGLQDLVAAQRGAGGQGWRVTLFWGAGPDAQFLPGVDVAAGLTPTAQLGVGDLDGDGLPDLVLCERAVGVHVFLNRRDRRFASAGAPLAMDDVRFPAMGDLDGDGRVDLVAVASTAGDVDPSSAQVGVWSGRGDGTFDPRPTLHLAGQGQPRQVAIADMNGDGALDLIVPGDAITIVLGDGVGGFYAPAPMPLPFQSHRVVVRDMDENGVPDIVWSADRLLELLHRAPTRPERQALKARPETVPIIQDRTQVAVHQAMQHVDDLGVRVRIEGDDVRGVSLALISPRGDRIELTDEARKADAASAYSGWFDGPLLAPMYGWQPPGHWVLEASSDGAAGSEMALTDFRVMTTGQFVRAAAP